MSEKIPALSGAKLAAALVWAAEHRGILLAVCSSLLCLCVVFLAVRKNRSRQVRFWADVDGQDGLSFERWCAELLADNGFVNVRLTPGSGDQGVDILAEKDDIRYAIQCKCYTADLGNTPVQEVFTGKTIYRCHVGAVMTNRHFTKGAREAAEATGVLLWDRDRLETMQAAREASRR